VTTALRPLLRSPAYRRLLANAAFASVGTGGDFTLIGWLALSITGEATWVGAAFAVYYLPMALLGLPAGSLADGRDRRTLLRRFDAGFALLLLGLAGLFYLAAPGIVLVLLLPLLLGAIRAVQSPLRLSYAYDIATSLHAVPALAGMSLAARLGMIPGGVLAGTLAELSGMSAALLAMAATQGLAWLALTGADPNGGDAASRPRQTIDRGSVRQRLRESFAEVRDNAVLRRLVAMTALVEILGISFLTVLPSVAEERVAAGAEALGWLYSAQGVGGFLAGLILFVRPPRGPAWRNHALSILALAVALLLLAQASGLPLLLLVMGLLSASILSWDVFTQSMMQDAVPDARRGRAMGAWILAIGCAPLGHLQIGLLAADHGAAWALSLNGAAIVLLLALFLLGGRAKR